MHFKISVTLFLFCVVANLSAQQYNFRQVTASGLPESECHFIRQDSKGYIWVSTDAGLAKYNGISFKTFSTANGLTDNTIFETSENKNGKTFYCSGNSKLGYIENDSAYTLPVTDTLAKCLSSGRRFIYNVSDYDEKNYLIATQNGFYLLNKKNPNMIQLLSPPDSVTFWVKVINGKAYGAFYPDAPYTAYDDSLHYKICIENEKKIILSVAIDDKHGLSGLSVFKPLLLSDGRLFVGFHNSIYFFSSNGNSEKINLPAPLLSVYQDAQNGIWLGMFQNGLFYYPDANTKNPPQHLLQECSVSGTCMDAEGGIWICTFTNGILYCPSLNVVTYADNNLDATLYALDYIPPHIIVNGLNNEDYFFSDKKHFSKNAFDFPNQIIGASAYLPSNGKIYVAGCRDSYIMDTSFHLIKRITDSTKIFTSAMYDIAQGKNEIWGINFRELLLIKDDTYKARIKLPSRGRNVAVDANGNVYVGTNNGLYMENNSSLVPVKELTCKINKLRCDANGKIWVCTDGKGIAQMQNGKIIHTWNAHDGFPSEICYDIAFDGGNQIWVGTNKGLCYIDLSGREKTKVFTVSHGLISNEIMKLAIMKKELYVGTPKGLCVIDIDKIDIDKIPPPIYISNILENNNSVKRKNNFTYEENNFTFIMEGISFENPSGILYLYRLNGLDTTWRTSSTSEITFNNLDHGNYKLEVFTVNSDGTKSKAPAVYSFAITPPFWKTKWFFILEFLLVCGGLYGIILWRTKIIRKKEADKTELNKMIAEYQMSAIRAKMNPHFIFNAINSIQNYILDNNTQYAYDYLAKFSKLIRQVLVNSEHNLITLKTELEMLGIYIELEQRRFSNKFEYEINTGENIPLDEIKIPTLLMQPFVENAIWHGIMNLPKDKTGKLCIHISLVKNELEIEIKDNGVGRKESLLKKNGNNHKSMGISLSQKRMEILKAIGHENIVIEIIDLYDEEKNATGTLVKITLQILS